VGSLNLTILGCGRLTFPYADSVTVTSHTRGVLPYPFRLVAGTLKALAMLSTYLTVISQCFTAKLQLRMNVLNGSSTPASGRVVLLLICRSHMLIDPIGFIFHGILCPNNQWSMAISHSPDKDMSFGLLFGLRRNINRLDDHKLHDSQFGVELRKDEQERLCEILKTVIEFSSSPALIPTLLIQVFSGALARSLTRQHDDIYAIETRTGMRKDTNSDMLELTPENRGQFGSITNDISSVLQEVAYMQYCCEVHLSTLEFLSVVNGRYTAECSNWDQITGELGSIRPRDTISAGIESTSSRLRGNRARANYLQKRAQSQVQAVCQRMNPQPYLSSIYTDV